MALQGYFGPRANKLRAVFGSDRAKMIHQGCFSLTWANLAFILALFSLVKAWAILPAMSCLAMFCHRRAILWQPIGLFLTFVGLLLHESFLVAV